MQGHTKVSLPPRGKSCLQIEHWKAVIDMQAGAKMATADRQACWAEERALGLKKYMIHLLVMTSQLIASVILTNKEMKLKSNFKK